MTPKQLGQIEDSAASGTRLAAEIARQNIPALCAALREAWRDRDILRGVLTGIETQVEMAISRCGYSQEAELAGDEAGVGDR